MENQINPLEKINDDVSIFKEQNFWDNRISEDAEIKNKDTFYKKLCVILQHKIFLFSSLSLASLFFVITAVQYWGSDYMEQVLKVENKHYRLLSFSIVCVSSPTLGVILGGWTISLIGGYESKHSILLCLIYALLAALFSIPAPLTDDLITFTTFLWLTLFFGGAIVPPLTGILISTIPSRLRGSANSITSLILNLLGYLPAPFVYGIINKFFKEDNPKIAFITIMYYSFTGVFFLSIACYFRYKHFAKIEMSKSLLLSSNLLDTRKLSKTTIHQSKGSIVSTSNNIAMVFGSYVNIADGNDVVEEEEANSDDNSTNNKAKYFSEKDDSEKNKNSKQSIPHMSLQTPQFNILQNSHEFDYLSKQQNSPEPFSNEESIFAPKKDSEFSQPPDIQEDAIMNINVERISKSYNDNFSEVLDKEESFKKIPTRKESEDDIKNRSI